MFKYKINRRSTEIWIVAIGLFFTTAKQLRFGEIPIGLGELILLTWMTSVLGRICQNRPSKLSQSNITKKIIYFWYFSFAFLFFGWIHASTIDRVAHNDMYDFSALLFSSLICICLSLVFNPSDFKNIFLIFASCFVLSSCLFIVLDQFNILPVEPWYIRFIRFMGWTGNPNQFALFILLIPFISLHIYSLSRNIVVKLYLLGLIFISIGLGYLSGSDALYVAWVIGFIFIIFYFSIGFIFQRKINNNVFVYLFTGLLFSQIILFLLLFPEKIFEFAQSVNPIQVSQAHTRIQLILNSLHSLMISPLYGLGPGAHSWISKASEGREAHNFLLDWSSNTGILGLITLLLLLNFVLKKAMNSRSISLVAALGVLVCFSLFHYTFRQPFFWFSLVSILNLAKLELLQKVPYFIEKTNIRYLN